MNLYDILDRRGFLGTQNHVILPHDTVASPIYNADAIWSDKHPDANYALYFRETIEACRDYKLAIDIIGYYPTLDLFLVRRKGVE